MWWLYVKKEESGNVVEYAYSRESDDLSGIIQYDKENDLIMSFVPCSVDVDSPFNQNVAIDKFAYHVVGEQFPDKRRVVIG